MHIRMYVSCRCRYVPKFSRFLYLSVLVLMLRIADEVEHHSDVAWGRAVALQSMHWLVSPVRWYHKILQSYSVCIDLRCGRGTWGLGTIRHIPYIQLGSLCMSFIYLSLEYVIMPYACMTWDMDTLSVAGDQLDMVEPACFPWCCRYSITLVVRAGPCRSLSVCRLVAATRWNGELLRSFDMYVGCRILSPSGWRIVVGVVGALLA